MFKKILVSVMLSLLFLGCERDLDINIRYDQIEGLKKGDRVIFEKNDIGIVKEVTYRAEGDYIVEVTIRKDFINSATEHSRFFIVADPQNQGNKAVEMGHAQKGGTPLQDGTMVEGSSKSSVFLDQIRNTLDKGIEGVKKQVDKFLEGLSSVPDSEDLKELEKEMNQLAEEMRRSGESVRERLQKEVLPQLSQELEALRKRLRDLGREKELKPLEDKMDEIKKI